MLPPGGSSIVLADVLAPPSPGPHTLVLDLLHEHVRWFGCETSASVEVRPALCLAILGEDEEAATDAAAALAEIAPSVRPLLLSASPGRTTDLHGYQAGPDARSYVLDSGGGGTVRATAGALARGAALLGDAALLRAGARARLAAPRGTAYLDALNCADALLVIGGGALRGERGAREAFQARAAILAARTLGLETAVVTRAPERLAAGADGDRSPARGTRDVTALLPDLAAAFRARRALVTGGLGFIGSNLARALVDAGAAVTLVDSLMPTHGGTWENVAGIEDEVEIEVLDVRDTDRLHRHLRDKDVLFNLAGQTSHLDSMSDPRTDLEINCTAQLSLLEACRRDNPSLRIVFAGTRQIYGTPRYLPVDEGHPIDPVDVNGINKTAGEWYHLLYGRVYGLPVTVLRLTNTYGPRMRVRDARQTFLGLWIRQALAGEELLVFGDGTQRRDFAYADDVVRALCLAVTSPEAVGQVFNVGGAPHVSLEETARLVVRLAGSGSYRLVPFPEDRKSIDIGDYYADDTKLRATLGWAPEVGLEEGLEATLDYYREHGERYWADA